jgi:superfamily II RNA helicase
MHEGEVFSLADRITRSGLSPDAILERFLDWLAESDIEPYPAQEGAFLELMAGRHVVLDTPTGSGKSLVATLLHFKAMCEGRRSFYTSPTKALASEKFFALCSDFGAENVGMLTGDASINPDAPIVCCTAEVLANIALRRGARAQIPYVCMDEFHFYGDRERGFAWQAPLLALPDTTFLLMSATLGDMSAIRADLERRTGRGVAHVHSDVRPVPLDFRYAETPLHETVEELLQAGLAPIYVVSFTQRDAAELAGALCSARVADRELRERIREAVGDFRFDSPYGKDVKRILAHGIGLHHAGLLPKYRLLVEQLAQAGLLRVISGTDTLGVGVNIPIRTVLFTGLAKFDGRKRALLGVREFKQIAGRAGRKGFDELGSVVCQAPEHVIEARRARRAGKKRPPPQRGGGGGRGDVVSWNRQTFERLIERPPETLVSRFRVTHDVAVNVLRREQEGEARCAYRGIVELIRECHESETRKRRLLREAAVVFRSLRRGGIVELQVRRGRAGRRVRVADELQWNFALLHNLSLYLVDAIACLDPSAEDYARDVLSLVEAILEDPRALLAAQVDRIRRELLAQLKADGVPYEERMRLLEEVTHPQPAAEFVRETFEIFRAHHPWVQSSDVRPKGIAREIFESYASFDGFVRGYGLQRFEGVLLRYLGQVYTTLGQSVPAAAKNDELREMEAFFRAMIEQVDSSLVQEWENLVHPGMARSRREAEPVRYDLALDERGLRARLRAEAHRLLHALAQRDWEEAARCVQADGADCWDAARFARTLEPFFAEHGALRFDHRARLAEFTAIRRLAARQWRVTQRLLDPGEQADWFFEAEVDLRGVAQPEGPLLRLVQISS